MCVSCIVHMCISVCISVCVWRVCAYVSVSTRVRPTTFVSRARNVNVPLSSWRETLIAGEGTSVRIALRPSVTHTHGEGDFSTYIINNRTTRRHGTTGGGEMFAATARRTL